MQYLKQFSYGLTGFLPFFFSFSLPLFFWFFIACMELR